MENQERQRAERLAERLRALGLDPISADLFWISRATSRDNYSGGAVMIRLAAEDSAVILACDGAVLQRLTLRLTDPRPVLVDAASGSLLGNGVSELAA